MTGTNAVVLYRVWTRLVVVHVSLRWYLKVEMFGYVTTLRTITSGRITTSSRSMIIMLLYQALSSKAVLDGSRAVPIWYRNKRLRRCLKQWLLKQRTSFSSFIIINNNNNLINYESEKSELSWNLTTTSWLTSQQKKIVKAVKATGAIVSGPIPLPTHANVFIL